MPPLPAKHPRQIPLEVTVYGPHNALRAANFGAKRLLLCRKGSSAVGGLTPTVQELCHLKNKIHIPISCAIRPRGAPSPSAPGESHDYIYSNNEFVQMSESIRQLKEAGVMNPIRGDSFVFGCVRRSHEETTQNSRDKIVVDRAYCRYLIDMAKPFGCIFNRAFDHFTERGNPGDVIAELTTLGFTGIMTAGGPGLFSNHVERLNAMCYHTTHIQLIVAGGVCCPEIQKLRKRAHDHDGLSIWLNGECLRPKDHDDPETTDMNGVMSLIDQLGLQTTD
ncbi:copper homeostasis CutC domain-containing protein [Fusarium redolens]|uniref:Copper homeostasis protein cutC homolog n=1 Tax=Fusarium redolens TaxID=48865 RepID=A0A9P9R4P0_FUSRE|nr:copper homeostasis CutC domain-containing protein [Fusarium redolens]KAH7266797.1 copper homeostasis CutC domain-containing protein [Fusarium redolens]